MMRSNYSPCIMRKKKKNLSLPILQFKDHCQTCSCHCPQQQYKLVISHRTGRVPLIGSLIKMRNNAAKTQKLHSAEGK